MYQVRKIYMENSSPQRNVKCALNFHIEYNSKDDKWEM